MVASGTPDANQDFPAPAELLPHAAPMVLLDAVLDATDDRIVCRTHVSSTSPLQEHGAVPSSLALEWMAQSVGALVGLKRRREGLKPRVGYLVGAREFSVTRDTVTVGTQVTVVAHRAFGSERVGSFDCSVEDASGCVARGSVNVFLPEASEHR